MLKDMIGRELTELEYLQLALAISKLVNKNTEVKYEEEILRHKTDKGSKRGLQPNLWPKG